MSRWDWRKSIKLWAPPLAGIAGMLLLGRVFAVAHYFLFVHHLFYVIGAFLLLNPIGETFWPSRVIEKKKRMLPQPSAKARARATARQLMQKQKLRLAPASPAERLTRLLKDKEAVDQKIEKLTAREKKYIK